MTISPGVINAFNVLLKIIIYSAYIAAPIIILLILLYQYERYNKWKAKEIKEAERIIVKMNEDIIKTSDAINKLEDKEKELLVRIERYQNKIDEMKLQSGIVDDEPKPDAAAIDLKKLTIRELQDLAKDKNIKGYTRMPKAKLLESLGG